MKNVILTLIVSIICLGLASFLFSLEKTPESNRPEQETNSQARLPSSKNNFLTASLNPNFIPIRNWTVKNPEIQARAAGVFDPNGEKFLFQKNIKEQLPIASLAKIMTALVVLENLKLDDVITISKRAVMTEGENGHLVIDENLNVRNLLHAMLIESSNDAATALANKVENFVLLMNKKAKELNLEDTNFEDPAGISRWNYSTISDLAQLTKYSFTNSLIWQILGIKEIDIYSQDKQAIKHHLVNTNKLLEEIPDEIIGGKTGYTDEADGCMLTIMKAPDKPGDYLVVVILGSKNREEESKKLIEWTKQAYTW